MAKYKKSKPLTADEMFGPPPVMPSGTVAETQGSLKRAKKLNASTLLEARRRACDEQTGSETPKKTVHPNTLAALEPTKWKPGQSGNPAGRPRSSTEMKQQFAEMTDLAREIVAMKAQLQHMRLQKALDVLSDPHTTIEDFELAVAVIEGTDMDAVNLILERGHGKALQKVEVDDKRDFEDFTTEEFDDFLITVGAKVTTRMKARRKATHEPHEGQRHPPQAIEARSGGNESKAARGRRAAREG